MAYWKAVSTWVSAIVVLSGVFGALLLGVGGASAAPVSGCNAVVHGENAGNDAVQLAINGAHAGATICLQAGTYPEQLTISTPGLHLVGSPGAVIDPTTGTVNAVDYDNNLAPLIAVVLVDNVSGVVLKDLTVNAGGAAASIGGCSPGIVGVDFQNVSSGKLVGSTVENAELSPSLLGCQSQTGVYVYTGYYGTGYVPSHATVTISGTTVSAYGKGGIVCDDPGLTCVIKSDDITGIGPTPAIAANGIQVAFGALGTISNDRVVSNDYTGAEATNDFYGEGYASAGILLYQAAAGTTVAHSILTNDQMGIAGYDDASDVLRGNVITNSAAYGIAEYGSPTTTVHISGNTIANPSTGAIGIFVANGTFYLSRNSISYALDSGDQGASQAITGPGTVYPSATAESIATAAVQAVSDGDPTVVHMVFTTTSHVSLRVASLAVFGGTVTISV